MLKNREFKAEKSVSRTLRDLVRKVSVVALADEGEEGTDVTTPVAKPVTTPEPESKPNATLNFEDLVAQARKEEKDKLYPKIKKLEDELKTMTQANNTNLIGSATWQKKYEELLATKGGVSEEERLKLTKEIGDLKAELEKVKAETPSEEKLREELRAEYEIKSYLAEQKLILETQKLVLPSLMEEIKGATKEEIDSSIESLKEKTIKIREEVGAPDPFVKNVATPKKPKTVNPVGGEPENFDINYVANLKVGSPEYAEFRAKQGLR